MSSKDKYRALFQTMDDGFCILKMEFDDNDKPIDYRYLETNPAFEKHTGLKAVEGKSIRELFPNTEEYWFQKYGKVALTGESARFENYAEELDRWFYVSASRIGNPEERKIAVFFKDITKRKQAEKEREQLLRQVKIEQKQMLDIFEHAPSFMGIMRGPDHIIERVNKLFQQLIGDRDVVGKPVREAIPESVEQGFIDLMDKVYETGESIIGTDVEVMIKRNPDAEKEGAEKRYLDFVYQPIYDPDGSISGVFLQGIDLTERKRAQEALKVINENLEERVEERTKALLSYQKQLRTLVFQLSRGEISQRQKLATELHDNLGQMLALSKIKIEALQKQKFAEYATNEIDELKNLMNKAISYTRDLTSDLKPPPSIHDDLKASINWVVEKVKKHGLRVTIEDDEQPKPLDEEVRVTVITSIRELLFNVVKHASVNEATIRLKRIDDQLQITVKDEGEGFEVKTKDFTPGKEGGFGLLNIKERIDLLGGSVGIESKLKKGTKITLHVPLLKEGKEEILEEVEQAGQPEKGKPFQAEQGGQIRVLLVDDHRMFRNGLRKIIEDQDDIKVVGEAGNGEEAVTICRKTPPDIVLMDVNMPVMDGIEATHRITADMPDIKVIGVSLHDSPEIMKDMRRAGATAFLTKTEAFESLIMTIRAEYQAE